MDENGALNAIVQSRKDTEANIDQVILKDGEIAVIEDGSGNPIGLRVGDGINPGGAASLAAIEVHNVSNPNNVFATTAANEHVSLLQSPITLTEGVWRLDAKVVLYEQGDSSQGGGGYIVAVKTGIPSNRLLGHPTGVHVVDRMDFSGDVMLVDDVRPAAEKVVFPVRASIPWPISGVIVSGLLDARSASVIYDPTVASHSACTAPVVVMANLPSHVLTRIG